MILRNKKGQERNFKILYKIEHNEEIYIVYEDYISSRFYVGLKKDNKLININEEETNFINSILKGVNGE